MVTHRNGVPNGGKSGIVTEPNRGGAEEPGDIAGMPRSYHLVSGACRSAMALHLQPPGSQHGNKMPSRVPWQWALEGGVCLSTS